MITTRAAVLTTVGGPLHLTDINVDDPEPHEVRIAVTHVGLCHSDLHYITGTVATELPVGSRARGGGHRRIRRLGRHEPASG